MHVLIAGISTRAAAESAARAGFQVTAIDAFGDLDQHPAVRSLSMPRDYGLKPTAAAVARAARALECDAVAYLSPFENHPRALATLASGRTLLGNAPEVLRRVRDPVELARALQRRGFRVPRVRTNESHAPNGPNGPNDPNDPNDSNERWLLKPFASGGGHRIRHWRPTLQIPRRYYLQEFIEGTAGSVVFMSGAGQSVPLGITRQIIGDAAFGASGFRYCGSILASAGPVGAERLAAAVTEEFRLVGLNVIDFVAHDGAPYAIEVNPRWSGSMELVERVVGVPLFALHAAACLRQEAPPVSLGWGRPPRVGALGKAIVFARGDVVPGDMRAWLDDPTVRDVPRAGERIAAGSPVCTVFAEGMDAPACHAALVRRADRVYADLAAWNPVPAPSERSESRG
jgi:predicted ATP-grasp superfamily ATP-dependent carboligase